MIASGTTNADSVPTCCCSLPQPEGVPLIIGTHSVFRHIRMHLPCRPAPLRAEGRMAPRVGPIRPDEWHVVRSASAPAGPTIQVRRPDGPNCPIGQAVWPGRPRAPGPRPGPRRGALLYCAPVRARPIVALIPAYQEGRRIGAVVAAAGRHLPVIVVDDGSTDDTAARAAAAGATVIGQRPKRRQGRGPAGRVCGRPRSGRRCRRDPRWRRPARSR